jgi:hypothetical protein
LSFIPMNRFWHRLIQFGSFLRVEFSLQFY